MTIGNIPVPAALFVTLLAVTLAPILLGGLIRPSTKVSTFRGRLQNRANTLLRSSADLLRRPLLMLQFAVANLIGFATAIGVFALAFRSLDIDVYMAETALFLVLLQLTTYLVITPGNLGLQELGFGGLAQATGIGLTPGLLAGAVVRITGVVALAILGLALGGVTAMRDWRARLPSTDGEDDPFSAQRY
jgi:hypothetical protein